LIKPELSRAITQSALDQFVLDCGQEVSRTTLNKDIRFLNWATRSHLVVGGLAIKKVKVAQRPVTTLSPGQAKDFLEAAARHPTLRLRVLLAVTTGLWRGDIEAIRIGDIHFDRNTIAMRNRKAGKAMAERPLLSGCWSIPVLDSQNEVYTNVDPVLRQVVGLLPVGDWI
jgi:integrase